MRFIATMKFITTILISVLIFSLLTCSCKMSNKFDEPNFENNQQSTQSDQNNSIENNSNNDHIESLEKSFKADKYIQKEFYDSNETKRITIYGLTDYNELIFEADWFNLTSFGGVAKLDGNCAKFDFTTTSNEAIGELLFSEDGTIELKITEVADQSGFLQTGCYQYTNSCSVNNSDYFSPEVSLYVGIVHPSFIYFKNQSLKDFHEWSYCGSPEIALGGELYKVTNETETRYYVVENCYTYADIYRLFENGALQLIQSISKEDLVNNACDNFTGELYNIFLDAISYTGIYVKLYPNLDYTVYPDADDMDLQTFTWDGMILGKYGQNNTEFGITSLVKNGRVESITVAALDLTSIDEPELLNSYLLLPILYLNKNLSLEDELIYTLSAVTITNVIIDEGEYTSVNGKETHSLTSEKIRQLGYTDVFGENLSYKISFELGTVFLTVETDTAIELNYYNDLFS